MSNDLNYTNYDFDDIVAQLQTRLLADSSAWKDVYESSTGQMLIELLGYVANLVLYYIERRAEESYIGTAQNKSSVINLVKLLNYEPKRVTSSSGILTFYVDAVNSYNISIPRWTECQTASGTKFVTTEEATLIKGQTSVEILAVQGEVGSISETSDGSIDQEYTIQETNVENSDDNNTLIIYVNGVRWTKVSSFLTSTNTSTHYRVVTNLDETVTIQFGNNIKGLAPSSGDTIVISYILSDGLDGNVYTNGLITTINDTIYNSNSDVVSDIHVTNANLTSPTSGREFLGGDDAEDIEEIRYEAPRVFATGDRAVTRTDHIAILENIAGIANANVWGELEEAEDAGTTADYEMLNKIKLCILLQEWELPDTTFKDTVSETLYDNTAMIAVKYEFVTPVILQVIPTFSSIVAVKGSSLTSVQNEVEAVLAEQFNLGTTSSLGSAIRYSNLVRAVDALDSVAYHTMELEIYKDLEENYSSPYDYGETLDATPIKAGSVDLYIDDVLVATDDGSTGTMVDSTSVYTVTGFVDYTTGDVDIDIGETLDSDSTIYVRYQQDNSLTNEDNDILTNRYEICKLYDVEVNSLTIIES